MYCHLMCLHCTKNVYLFYLASDQFTKSMQFKNSWVYLFKCTMVRPGERRNYFIRQSYMYLHVFKKVNPCKFFIYFLNGGSSNIPTANLIGSHSSKRLNLVYILVSGENSNVPYCNLKIDLQFIKSLNPCLIIWHHQILSSSWK